MQDFSDLYLSQYIFLIGKVDSYCIFFSGCLRLYTFNCYFIGSPDTDLIFELLGWYLSLKFQSWQNQLEEKCFQEYLKA